ncbi:MAG: transcriptional regulator [Anaerocolumna aminovalerica]|uniref:helix-turn-helix domain-containing protein n=1 Tax=Anaerocolumna aminovalerica TaxID=1527 RepID=UPI0029061078|nr:transcriptional regulator [Anaerocolumna aminovalerica]MDU6263791.1 transcriptional regulator [Anaerocolumna aminovalerica]
MYKILRIEMYKRDITISALAEELGIAEKTLRNKINGVTEFTWSEVLSIRKLVSPDMSLDELFQKEDSVA